MDAPKVSAASNHSSSKEAVKKRDPFQGRGYALGH